VIARLPSKLFFLKTRLIPHFSRILDEDGISARLARYQESLKANRKTWKRESGEAGQLSNAIEAMKRKYLSQ